MRRSAGALVLVAALAWLALLGGRAACPGRVRAPAHTAPTTLDSGPDPGPDSGSSPWRRSERPAVAPPGSSPRPDLASAIIELRREPQRPGEGDHRYQMRRQVLDAYDRFRAAANLSPAQEQEVVRILADAQRNLQAIDRESVDTLMDAINHPTSDNQRRDREFQSYGMSLYEEAIMETRARLQQLLTPAQYQAWQQTMEGIWISLPASSPVRIERSPVG